MYGERTTAREVMNSGALSVRTDQTALDAARIMAEQSVGALPICGKDGKLKGVVTDRDLVVKVMAAGRDLSTFPAGELNQNEAVTIGADDSPSETLTTMVNHGVRRLPVIEGQQLVGMISIADVASALPNPEVGDLVEALSAE